MTLKSIRRPHVRRQQNLADVDKPFVWFYKNGQVSSRLIAPLGRVQMETHEIEACGGIVTVVSSDSSTLTTERLRYDPKKQKIFSG